MNEGYNNYINELPRLRNPIKPQFKDKWIGTPKTKSRSHVKIIKRKVVYDQCL